VGYQDLVLYARELLKDSSRHLVAHILMWARASRGYVVPEKTMTRHLLRMLIPLLLVLLVSSACAVNKPVSDTSTSPQQTEKQPPSPEQRPPVTESPDNPDDTISYPFQLPPGWPESVPIMDGFSVDHSAYSRGGKMLLVFASGNVGLDEARAFYSEIEGWTRDAADQYEGVKWLRFSRNKEKLDIEIRAGQEKNDLWIFYTNDYPPDE
jgi:hypothetical protein